MSVFSEIDSWKHFSGSATILVPTVRTVCQGTTANWAMIWGGAKRMGGAKRTGQHTLQKSFQTPPKELLVC